MTIDSRCLGLHLVIWVAITALVAAALRQAAPKAVKPTACQQHLPGGQQGMTGNTKQVTAEMLWEPTVKQIIFSLNDLESDSPAVQKASSAHL